MPRRPRYKTFLDGLLVVDKPLGLSSMDVVRRVRHAAGFCKTGHGGTLDPLATGVVVCCLGKATTLVESLMAGVKIYETQIDLSAFTPTDDREGERTEVTVTHPPTLDAVQLACATQVGRIQQRPPAYSAIHVNGQRAYKLARQGQAVDLPPRTVSIDAIDILDYAFPHLHLRITCGKGVYIRSIARDLGQALGTGGHLAALRRTRVGRYTLDKAVPIERLEQPITQQDLTPPPRKFPLRPRKFPRRPPEVFPRTTGPEVSPRPRKQNTVKGKLPGGACVPHRPRERKHPGGATNPRRSRRENFRGKLQTRADRAGETSGGGG